jgi:hypothetical protein
LPKPLAHRVPGDVQLQEDRAEAGALRGFAANAPYYESNKMRDA